MNPLHGNKPYRVFAPDHAGATATAVRSRGRVAAAAAFAVAATMLPVAVVAEGNDFARSMGGKCTTTFEFTSAETVHLEGTCRLQHLGLTTLVAEQSVTPQPDGSLLITNAAVYQAASGDILKSNFVGVGVFTSPTSASFSGTETYRDGTGRFADALGSVALRGTATFTSPGGGVGEYTTSGFVVY